MKTEKPKGRPGSLTREIILREAMRLESSEFSFGKVAELLGVSLQALYYYFPNKEALSEALAEEINRSVHFGDHDRPWHAYMRKVLFDYRDFLKQSEYAFGRGAREDELSFFRISGQPSERLLGRFNGFIITLRREGLALPQCIEIWIIFQDFVRHSALTGASQETLLEGWNELQTDLANFDLTPWPELQELPELSPPEIEATYNAAVDNLISGIAHRYNLDL